MIELEVPAVRSPAALDRYLEQGWFRTGFAMARAPLVCMEGDIFATLDVRVRLRGHAWTRSQRRSLRRGERFEVRVDKPRCDAERERLYDGNKPRFAGFVFETLAEVIEAEPFASMFDTRELSVYDDGKLIAVSYFDLGERSLASLLGLYDESYARFGLGIHTMLLEMELGKRRGYHYYYPGYALRRSPRLDYKLRLGGMQYRSGTGSWRALARRPAGCPLIDGIQRRTARLMAGLRAAGVAASRLVYPFFWLDGVDLLGKDFVAGPLVLDCGEVGGTRLLAEYAPIAQRYRLSRVRVSEVVREFIAGSPSADMERSRAYAPEPLEVVERLVESSRIDPLVRAASRARREMTGAPGSLSC